MFDNTLNQKELKHDFDRNGYVHLSQFLTRAEVKHFNLAVEKFIKDVVPSMPVIKVFYENKNDPDSLKQLQDIHEFDPFFSSVLFGSKFEKMAELMLGEKAIGKTLEYFNKPSRIGKPTPPHQDGYYFMLKPSSAVTMWLALEDADEANGCIRYIKASHLKGMRPHERTRTLGFSQGISDYGSEDFAAEISFPAKAGDLLIHHSLTIHRADGNSSRHRSRKALGFIYFGESAKEDVEAKKAYQNILAEELVFSHRMQAG